MVLSVTKTKKDFQAVLQLCRSAALGDGDANALEGFDHFISGFGTEVLDLEEILVAETHQVRHGVDLGPLEAVVGANRKVQFLNCLLYTSDAADDP